MPCFSYHDFKQRDFVFEVVLYMRQRREQQGMELFNGFFICGRRPMRI